MCLLCRLSLCRPQTQIMGRNLGGFHVRKGDSRVCSKSSIAFLFRSSLGLSLLQTAKGFGLCRHGIWALHHHHRAGERAQARSELFVLLRLSVPHPKFCARKRVRVHRRPRRQSGVLRLSRSLLSSLSLTLGICAHFYFT